MALSIEEKEYLDDKFNEFRKALWAKFKIPAIGLVIVFAGIMSAFASYMYVKAKSDVAQAQVDFYQNMISTQKEITELKTQMINNFNEFINDISEQKKKLTDIIAQEEVNQQKRIEEQRKFIGPPIPEDTLKGLLEQKLYKRKRYDIDPRQFFERKN